MPFPEISPFIIQFGSFGIRWYSLMYIIGFSLAWAYYRFILIPRGTFPIKKEAISDLLFYAFIGLILGARTFYMLFYNMDGLLENPLSYFEVWKGGLSFHGGLVGIVSSVALYARYHKIPLLSFGDQLFLPIPLALFFGRIGNFINGELFGRITTQEAFPYCIVFPQGGPYCRYPSQLFEAVGEGLILFVLINLGYYLGLSKKPGATTGLFLLGYGMIRMSLEFTREPDAQLGLLFQYFSMGQLLSFPLLLIGLLLLLLPATLKK